MYYISRYTNRIYSDSYRRENREIIFYQSKITGTFKTKYQLDTDDCRKTDEGTKNRRKLRAIVWRMINMINTLLVSFRIKKKKSKWKLHDRKLYVERSESLKKKKRLCQINRRKMLMHRVPVAVTGRTLFFSAQPNQTRVTRFFCNFSIFPPDTFKSDVYHKRDIVIVFSLPIK